MSKLALALIAEASERRFTRLELGNCGLTELPIELFELTWLEELILSNNWNEYSFEKNEWEFFNSSNYGEKNSIKSFNRDVNKLSNLIKLIANGEHDNEWELNDLHPLENLVKLKHFDVSSTKVRDLTPLSNFKQLQCIKISNTKVRDLNPLINLSQLRVLNISSAQVNNIKPLENLINIEMLSIYDNMICDLKPLEKLVNLHSLLAYRNEISQLIPLSGLINLRNLFISRNPISDLSPISGLTNLRRLEIFGNEVSDLLPLQNLQALESLFAPNNNISDIKGIEKLVNLKTINICENPVNDLTPLKNLVEKGAKLKWERGLGGGNGIYVENCPLDKALIAAIKKGSEAVTNYFNKPKKRLFEARVLLLGEPRAGKTTLRRKLKSSNAPMPTVVESTKAFEIEVEPYPCIVHKGEEKNKMIYHLWDFGGQDYYRLLHQLFVAEQSVYIIVTDTDRNKNEEEIDFWLDTIQRLGKDKKGQYSPVILFQNPKTNREGNDFIDLKKRYPFWQQSEQFVINLNSITENTEVYDKKELERFKRFKKYLEESFCKLEHIGKEMPTQWINVRKALVKYEKDNWVSVETFYKVCELKGINKTSDQEDLLDIFHTLGYLLNYKNSALKGMVILNREWVTDALYRVLDDEIVRKNKGWFKKEDAEKIWYEVRYKNRTTELLTLMEVFKLSYFNITSQKHVVPAKLPEDTEGLPIWLHEQTVRLHLQYDWMPRAIPMQLIVSLHDNIVPLDNGEQWIWRRGAVLDGRNLELKNVQIRIEDNWRENKIEISAKGEHSESLIRIIMKNWREVNQPFEDKVEVTKVILCPCIQCSKSKKPHTFKYESVLNALEKNKKLQCNESLDEFLATDILRGVFDETTVTVDAFEKKGGEINEKIIDYIKNGQIKEALEELVDNEFTINLKQRYSILNRNNSKGLLSLDEVRLQENKITIDLLNYLNENFLFRSNKKDSKGYFKDKFKQPLEETIEKKELGQTIIYNYGQLNLTKDHIKSVEYNTHIGVSREEFDIIKHQIEKLSTEKQHELKLLIEDTPTPTNELEKQSLGKRVYNWLNSNSEEITKEITAATYFEALKYLLMS